MKKIIQEMFKDKDKKAVYTLCALFAAGVLALLLSGSLSKSKPPENEPVIIVPELAPDYSDEQEYVGHLEHKLEDILSCVWGAGEVRVMITQKYGTERFIARDINTNESSMTENDNTGGSRDSAAKTSAETAVRNRPANGADEPFVLKEGAPVIEGVIIIAKGGDDVFVKDALTKAAYTVLGIEPHKVQVLRMKN